MTPAPFRFTWSESSIAEFWNRLSTQPGSEYQYFSLQRGRSVLRYLQKQVDMLSAGPVVDIGCGQGHMLRFMLEKHISCLGVDISVNSVEGTSRQLSTTAGFLGTRLMKSFDQLPLESQSVGGVLLMETIEHLFEDKVVSLMAEIRRVLKPGGFVFITTPNNENLSAKEVSCDNCGCIFHPVQHMQSLNTRSLDQIMSQAGFARRLCKSVIFLPDWRVYWEQSKRNLKTVCPSCHVFLDGAPHGGLRRVLNLQIRNLIYLGYR